MESFSDLKRKEVINLCDGSRLGHINDLLIDLKCGKIEKVIVPALGKCWGILSTNEEYVIPWECIKKIGDDIILAEVRTRKSD